MKSSIVRTLALLVLTLAPVLARAEVNLSKDFDSLGGNEKLYQRAKALDPKNRVSIVQKRVVDRNSRIELGVSYGLVAGGESYLNTQNLGASLDYHFTPYFSVGGRFAQSNNTLTSEGKDIYENARNQQSQGNTDFAVKAIDEPQQSMVGVVSFYPVYGKTNLFDLAVVQFDFYALAGYGQIKLESGWTSAVTAGGGVGFWLTQHIASRLEARWQGYSDRDDRRVNSALISLGLGLML